MQSLQVDCPKSFDINLICLNGDQGHFHSGERINRLQFTIIFLHLRA